MGYGGGVKLTGDGLTKVGSGVKIVNAFYMHTIDFKLKVLVNKSCVIDLSFLLAFMDLFHQKKII